MVRTNSGGTRWLRAAVLCLALAACGSESSTPPQATDGPTLYANNCASCHGPLASSAKRGATAATISAAIRNDVGNMGVRSSLTAAQIDLIAAALATTAPPQATDGPTLYANNCASCHGPLASSAKRGATAAAISAAIRNVFSMGGLSSLTAAQIDLIAATLAP